MQVVGGALAISLLTSDAVPFWAGILITAAASFCLLPLEQAGIRKLEAFFAILMGTIAACFGIMYLTVQVPTDKVVHGGLISACCCTCPHAVCTSVPPQTLLSGSHIPSADT